MEIQALKDETKSPSPLPVRGTG